MRHTYCIYNTYSSAKHNNIQNGFTVDGESGARVGLFENFFFNIQIVKGLRGFSEIGGSVDRAPECIGSGPAIASTVQYTVH